MATQEKTAPQKPENPAQDLAGSQARGEQPECKAPARPQEPVLRDWAAI